MNKSQKLEYQLQIEKYLEEHQVYETFEYLLKGLAKDKPKDPIAYMMDKLEKPDRNFPTTGSETDLLGGAAWLSEEGNCPEVGHTIRARSRVPRRTPQSGGRDQLSAWAAHCGG